jgi:ribosomal protein L11 methyltransferase
MSHSRPVASVSRMDPATSTTLYELRVRVPEALAEELGALMVEAGAGGVVEEPAARGRVEVVIYGEERTLAALGRLALEASAALGRRATVELRPAGVATAGWETAFLDYLEPVEISRTLRLVPLRDGASPEASRPGDVFLEPVAAFGFGEHPTTRMAARAVERRCRKASGVRVLDVGTGTGVLAIVAVRAGAREAVGVDIDGQAVMAARANAARNGVEKQCRFSKTAVGRIPGRFDVVVANVDRGTLLRLAPLLTERVAAGGSLLLTGVLPSDGADLKERYGSLGFEVAARRREGEFLFLEMKRGRVRKAATRSSAPLAGGAARARPGRSPRGRKKTRTPRNR